MSGDASALRLQSAGTVVRFGVHVQPRATRSEIVGLHGASLKIRLAAAPVDGAANAALIELLAAALGVPRRAVRIATGTSARMKMVEVDGITAEQVRRLATDQKTR